MKQERKVPPCADRTRLSDAPRVLNAWMLMGGLIFKPVGESAACFTLPASTVHYLDLSLSWILSKETK